MSEFEKYPLMQKAYDEQRALLRFLGEDPDREYRAKMKACVSIAENCIDGDDSAKENVMVSCVLLSASPYTFDNISGFSTDYNDEIKDIVDLILDGDKGKIFENPALSQATLILGIIAMDNAIETFHRHKYTDPDIAEKIAEMPKYFKKSFQEHFKAEIISPKLYNLASQTIDKALISFNAKSSAKKPFGPSKGAFKF